VADPIIVPGIILAAILLGKGKDKKKPPPEVVEEAFPISPMPDAAIQPSVVPIQPTLVPTKLFPTLMFSESIGGPGQYRWGNVYQPAGLTPASGTRQIVVCRRAAGFTNNASECVTVTLPAGLSVSLAPGWFLRGGTLYGQGTALVAPIFTPPAPMPVPPPAPRTSFPSGPTTDPPVGEYEWGTVFRHQAWTNQRAKFAPHEQVYTLRKRGMGDVVVTFPNDSWQLSPASGRGWNIVDHKINYDKGVAPLSGLNLRRGGGMSGFLTLDDLGRL
jgi:hypothetical protein